MKKIVPMFAVFGLAALVAGYLALAPMAPAGGSSGLVSILDTVAGKITSLYGQQAAVFAALGLGAVLSIATGFIMQSGKPTGDFPPPARKVRVKARKAEQSPGPVWRAAPLPPEPASAEPLTGDRIASLRRRALGEPAPVQLPWEIADNREPPVDASAVEPEDAEISQDESNTVQTDPAPLASLPRPVVLIRKPREPLRDWFGDTSWLGGLPRLGETQWPRDPVGVPLPFAAQINLADIARACPESPLPRFGSLAFFLGTGAVVAVAEGDHDFSEPPAGLPPAYDEGGYPFPASANRLSRHFFPFWPVEPVALDLPAELLDHRDGEQDGLIENTMADLLAQHAEPRSFAFSADGDMLWWHSVNHLADQLHVALEGAGRLVALREDGVRHAQEALQDREAETDPDDPALDAARADVARHQESLAAIEAQCAGLPDVIEALDRFTAGRDTWQALTAEERGVVEDLLAELHASYRDAVRYHVPFRVADLATLSLRAMMAGAPDALAALPEAQLERINREFRLPTMHQHQMFGLGGCQQTARDDHRGDILLLQLGYDDMMEWRWGDMGLFQFWISPEDAAAQNWAAAQLTFECA